MSDFTNPKPLLQLIPDDLFLKLLKKWHVDKKVSSLTTIKQFKVMALSYILGTKTLREIEMTFGVARSTFADACQKRCSGFFEDLCKEILYLILNQTRCRQQRAAIRDLLAIDSSTCQLPSLMGRLLGWRSSSNKKKGACKLHVVWNVEKEWVEDFRITSGIDNDLPVAKKLKLRSECTYVFDRAYVDLAFWIKIETAKSHFVTRLKKQGKQLPLLKKTEEENPHQTGVLYDGDWHPSATACLRAGFPPKVLVYRQIIYKDPQTLKVFHFITSDFESDAQLIADIYKKRWSIELLFKWLKGHLRLRSFAFKSKNAIRSWLAVGLGVHLLLSLKKIIENSQQTLCQLLREIKVEMLLEIPTVRAFWDEKPPPRRSDGPIQYQLDRKMTGH